MINLLPADRKLALRYARRNASLLKVCFICSWVIAGVFLFAFGGIFFMERSAESYAAQATSGQEQLRQQNLDGVQKETEEISNNLKLVTQVLSKEVLFSKLIRQIGSAMPPNTSLSDLKISKTEGGIDLTAVSTDYNAGTQVQINLSDPANKIFDQADLVSITCGVAGGDSRYPCTVSIRARFGKNNQFLFINKDAK